MTLKVNHLHGFNAIRRKSVVLLGEKTTTGTTIFTFTSLGFGSVSSQRRIAVGFAALGSGDSERLVSSATIGGVSASVIITNGMGDAGQYVSGILLAHVPTGASGDVIVTLDGALTSGSASIYGYRLENFFSYSAFHTANDDGVPIDMSLNVPSSGLVLGCAAIDSKSSTAVTGITKNSSASIGRLIGSAFFVGPQTGRAIQFSSDDDDGATGVSASFG